MSYYTFFAIAPLFILVLAIAGFWFGKAIQSLVAAANRPKTGFWAASIAVGTVVVAATSVFVQLQDSLNKIWNVRHKRGRGLRNFIRHRLLSFAMIFGMGFLLLVSLVVSAGLSAVGNFMGDVISGKEIFLKTINFMVSLGIITVLFAMIFKFLPDVKIMWRNVWLGGFITALLFNPGKFFWGFTSAEAPSLRFMGRWVRWSSCCCGFIIRRKSFSSARNSRAFTPADSARNRNRFAARNLF